MPRLRRPYRRHRRADAARPRLRLGDPRSFRAARQPRRDRRTGSGQGQRPRARRGCSPIVAIGETLAQRDGGQTLAVVAGQLAGSLPEGSTAENTVIAYEPVWAIGTGRTATVEQVAEVHAPSGRAETIMGADGARGLRLLYGGSVTPANAQALLTLGRCRRRAGRRRQPEGRAVLGHRAKLPQLEPAGPIFATSIGVPGPLKDAHPESEAVPMLQCIARHPFADRHRPGGRHPPPAERGRGAWHWRRGRRRFMTGRAAGNLLTRGNRDSGGRFLSDQPGLASDRQQQVASRHR